MNAVGTSKLESSALPFLRFFTKTSGIVLFSVCTVYNSGSVLLSVNNTIGFVFLACSIIMMLLLNGRRFSSIAIDPVNVLYFTILLMWLLSFLVNFKSSTIGINIRFFAIIAFSYMFVKIVRFCDFVKYYLRILSAIVMVSLLFYIFINFFHAKISLPIIQNVNGVKYYNGWLFYTYTYLTTRNMGVFWEPGIFSSFIAIGMVLELFYTRHTSWIRMIVFSVGMLSTYSTAGYGLLSIVYTMAAFKKASSLKGAFVFVILFISTLVAAKYLDTIILKLVESNPLVFMKLVNWNDSISFLDRMQSPLINLRIFVENPIFGSGLGNVDSIYANYTKSAQTSTSTFALAAFGFLGIMPTIMLVYGIMRQRNLLFILKVLQAMLFLFILNKEPHMFFPATFIIIFYLLDNSREMASFSVGARSYCTLSAKTH